jgi:hypothetical protein
MVRSDGFYLVKEPRFLCLQYAECQLVVTLIFAAIGGDESFETFFYIMCYKARCEANH